MVHEIPENMLDVPNKYQYESFNKLMNQVSDYHKTQKQKFFERENSKLLIELESKRAKRNKHIH